MRATQIIATLGKASSRKGTLLPMAQAGMDIARVNFSHENEKIHAGRMRLIRDINELCGTCVKILLDLRGPEIRLWMPEEVSLKEGETVTLSLDGPGLRLSNPALIRKLDIGSRVLVDDGFAELSVVEKTHTSVTCAALADCTLKPRKSVGSEFITLNQQAITPADRTAIRFGARQNVDSIALSHVRTPDDVKDARSLAGGIPLISKIENYDAVKNLARIAEASDGIMVARGDLGVNIPLELVPIVQEHALRLCAKSGIPCTVATQMMESMTDNRRPTRAEVNDVYTAVRQGASSVMLSGETAIGRYPAQAVGYMRKIIEIAESKGALLNQLEAAIPVKRVRMPR